MSEPKPVTGKRLSWTQAICGRCWGVYGQGEPHRISQELREWERCGFCGDRTKSGIYTRADPMKVPYPRMEWKQ